MLIEPVFQRLELTLDTTLRRLSGNALALLPLLIAAGFATTAGAVWAAAMFGPVIGFLIVAGVLAILSAVIYAVQLERRRRLERVEQARLAAIDERNPVEAFMEATRLGQLPQMLMDGARAAAPEVAKSVLREAPKNLPLLIGAGIGLIVAQRIVDAASSHREA